MRNLKGEALTVKELLERWPTRCWCQAYFKVVKCKNVDNNICETYYEELFEAKSKLIITMFEEIRQYVDKYGSCQKRVCYKVET